MHGDYQEVTGIIWGVRICGFRIWSIVRRISACLGGPGSHFRVTQRSR